MTETEHKQVVMHKDFFDRCRLAVDNGFYLEALFMEYAAIESRLEAICGTLGLPCGKDCFCRKDVNISARIKCLRSFQNKNKDIFAKTKLPDGFLTDKGILKNWILERNVRVHGLFKNEVKFNDRISKNKDVADDGLTYARLLYNEAKRLRRLKTTRPDLFENAAACCKIKNCKANITVK